MEPSFDEAFDFDLNFIQQPVQNVMSNNKLRKAILIAKKKTIATDSLIKKYLAKKEVVRQSELMLNSAKEECKRVCIDYKDTLEKCTSLEKELQKLDEKYKTLESNYMLSQNQCDAIKSHANQLQSLIKENELKIESLQLENRLLDSKKEKESKGNQGKDTSFIKENGCKKESQGNHDKCYLSLKKENARFFKHILLFKDIIMGKTKLQKEHRLILNKYKLKKESEISNELHDDNYSSDGTDFFDDVTSPPSNETLLSAYQNHNEKTAQLKVFKENIDDQCLLSVPNGIQESELDSEDTGRGSSLAFSDTGKFFNSPDYYSEKYLDASTNTSCNIEHKATSPLMFDDVSLLSDNIGMPANRHTRPRICSPEYFITDIPLSTEVVTIREKIKMVDCASSPIPEVNILNASLDPSKSNCKITIEDLMMDVSLSLDPEVFTTEDKFETVDCATSPIQGIDHHDASLSPIEFDDIYISKYSDKKGTENGSVLNPALEVEMGNDSSSKGLAMSEKICKVSTAVENLNLPQISSVDLSTNAVVEICQNNTLEKNCLEENNSDNISIKSNDDKEIEMIFSSMRLEHRLLTPIPHTPLKLKKTLSRMQPTVMQENCGDHKCCKNIISLEKKYLMLQKNYAAMEKVIKSMKSSLQALSVLPLKSIDDGWMNEGSTDVYSDNEADNYREADKVEPNNTQSNLKCINHYDSMKYSNKSNIESRMSLSENAIEEVMEVNDDENVPLSKLIYENVNRPKAYRSITYEDNVPTKSPDRIISRSGSISPEVNIHHVRNVSPERNVSPARNIVDNTNSTQNDDHHHKIKPKLKHKKLSKLDKLRHKMLPKYKISGNANKTLHKKKSIVTTIKKSETDTLLRNKLAFEKAVKIMAEAKTKNNTVRNIDKVNRFSSENVMKKYDDISKLNLISIDTSIGEKVMLGEIKADQKQSSASEDTNIKSNGRTTRSKSQNVSEISNEEESIENDTKSVQNNENDINKSISNSKSIITTNEPNFVKQKTEHIELECDKLCNSVKKYRRTTRSQSKLSESEGDTSLRHKHHQNIVIDDNMCTRTTEGDTIDSEELKGKSNISSQSKVPCVALSSTKQTVDSQTDDTSNNKIISPGSRKRSRALCDELFEPIPKRVLRSSKAKETIIENINNSSGENNCLIGSNKDSSKMDKNKLLETGIEVEISQNKSQKVIDYGDINIFTTTENNSAEKSNVKSTSTYPKNSILCKSIDKYGKKSIRYSTNKVTEQMSNSICTKLEEDISHIAQMPADKINQGLNKLVEDVQKMPIKTFLAGFMKYLKQPMRKQEMFKLVNTPPAPPMTKSEQILLFVIRQLKQDHTDIVESILANMEFSLFQLNKTPEFDIVESMSHFYAIVCRYFGLKHRLRLFLLDAMYCLSFKAVTVVKNCLDVWMHILPLAHMGIAKSPLVTCLVYLLHFYKCDDKFKKIDVIRNTLQHKYFYKITEMTEAKMLEMFMNAVKQINDVLIEKKILRTALIILAKRRGAVWCQKNIIKNILLPIIEKVKCSDVSKQFAVSMLGPLVKPYPMDMKVHSEIIVNQLMDMLDQNPTDSMKEAIFTSLIFMSRQNHFRVTQALLNWEPESVSQEFEEVIKDFVTEKPIKTWTKILPKMLFQQS